MATIRRVYRACSGVRVLPTSCTTSSGSKTRTSELTRAYYGSVFFFKFFFLMTFPLASTPRGFSLTLNPRTGEPQIYRLIAARRRRRRRPLPPMRWEPGNFLNSSGLLIRLQRFMEAILSCTLEVLRKHRMRAWWICNWFEGFCFFFVVVLFCFCGVRINTRERKFAKSYGRTNTV